MFLHVCKIKTAMCNYLRISIISSLEDIIATQKYRSDELSLLYSLKLQSNNKNVSFKNCFRKILY